VSTVAQIRIGPRPKFPLVCCWGGPDAPLPVRPIHAPLRRHSHRLDSRLRWNSGFAGEPFEFCKRIADLCRDVCQRVDPLRHLDLSRILFGVTQARNAHAHGLQARVTPLRFHGGRLTRQRRGVTYQVQRYFVDRHEILYLVTFCLPRFLDLDFDEKLITLFHELYHISPAFDGDLRRHDGRYAIHSHSQRRYDEHMAHLARTYLDSGAEPRLHAFLRLNFAQLQSRHGAVVGVMVPRPKIVPVPAAKTTMQ
jgi:Putative phage metallopeptidase